MEQIEGSFQDLMVDLENNEEEVIMFFILGIATENYGMMYLDKEPCRTSLLRGHDYVIELINGHESRCHDNFRMSPQVFIQFCEKLKSHGLKHSRCVSVQEQVAIFLIIIAHAHSNRVTAERFQHSGETISKYFHRVLKAVCKLGVEIIRPPDFNIVPTEIRNNPKYYPFFENCIGAIDGTHVDAFVPENRQIPYRGKKIETTQNVMCVCSFDMRFTYVMSGWEGTANDARIFLECVSKPENKFPLPPGDKYYVVDSGFTNMPGFLSPYRGERYHLADYRNSGRLPRGREEIFNFRHSSLRNVVERCFGVLKKRFKILKIMPSYPLSTQKYIPTVCCALHNFIRIHDSRDRLFLEFEDVNTVVESEDRNTNTATNDPVAININQAQIRQMANVRDAITDRLWESVGD